MPSALSDLADIRRAAVVAVADFQRREAATAPLAAAAAEEPSCSDSSARSSSDDAGSSETSEPSTDAEFEPEVLVTMDSDMFRLDMFPELELGTYYMSLAEALLMDPPPPATATGAYWDNADCFDGVAAVTLWSY